MIFSLYRCEYWKKRLLSFYDWQSEAMRKIGIDLGHDARKALILQRRSKLECGK